MGCRSCRWTAALRTRGLPARGGGPGLAPLPPATRIMGLRVSYLPPYAPCVMAASGLCLLSPTPKPHGGGRRPLGGAPKTPAAAPPDWRVVGPAGARYEPPPPSIHLPRPLDPPPVPPAGAARPARAVRARFAPCCIIRAVRAARRAEGPRTTPSAPPHDSWRYRPTGAWRAVVQGGRGDRALRTRPQRGSVPTAPGTDTRWEVATPPPITAPRPREEGNSPRQRPPPGRGKVPTARLILAPHFLFVVIPLGRPGPQSPRRVSSWGRTLRTSVTETQVVVSHPADVGSLRPHGTPGHPGHPSRG